MFVLFGKLRGIYAEPCGKLHGYGIDPQLASQNEVHFGHMGSPPISFSKLSRFKIILAFFCGVTSDLAGWAIRFSNSSSF